MEVVSYSALITVANGSKSCIFENVWKTLSGHSGHNLHLKMASKPPITLEDFNGIGPFPIATRRTSDRKEIVLSDDDLGEKKLQSNTKAPDIQMSKQSSREDPINDLAAKKVYLPAKCLFCNIQSPSTDDNCSHMQKTHGTFIPYEDDLGDLEGLLSYLSRIIFDFSECLYCGKVKETVAGIQSHMLDKGHCMFPFTEDLEQFYQSWNASVDTGEDNLAFKDAVDRDTNTTDGASQRPSTQPEHNFHPDSDQELHLPSGRTAGHRSMSRYYRQNLHSYPTPDERSERRAITASTSDGDTPPHLPSGRQLATTARKEMGMIGVGEFQRRALRATEKKALKQESRARNQAEWKVNKEANHQKHYRASDKSTLEKYGIKG